MPRQTRSDIHQLLQEARAIEMVANEAAIQPDRIQDYWTLSADLIALVNDIEEYEVERPSASYEDPALFAFKHRLRAIVSRLADMTENE